MYCGEDVGARQAKDAANDVITKPELSGPQDGLEAESYESLVLYLVHDLEGPLAAMQTLLRLLDQGRFDTKRELHARLLKSTHAAMSRVRLIVSDMLKSSQLEDGSQHVVWLDFPLHELLSDCVDLVQVAAMEQKVTVMAAKYDRNLCIRADRKMLARVLDNLLFNAIRHSDPGGTVRLTVSEQQQAVVICIFNKGQGLGDIDPNELFEKFRQVHHRKNAAHRGAGLGLYFCKLAMTAMRGEIKAYQTEAGETCFSISVVRGGKEQ